ncbi:MAG: PQQ-binding-like beta-propeller repeat protein [Vicinamibacterales bacterium]
MALVALVALVVLGATLSAQRQNRARPASDGALSLRPLWSQPLGAALSAPPAFEGAHAYIPLDGERLEAFDLTRGARRWVAEVSPVTRPAVGESLVFVETSGELLALKRSDGSIAWRLALSDPLAAPIAWDIGWLITLSQAGVVSAYRAVDGHLLWQYETGIAPSAAAALAADRVYVPLSDGRIVALQVETGTLLWEQKLGGAPSDILALDDRIFAGSADRWFYAIDPRSGGIEWRWRTGGTIVGRPALDDRHVYFVSLDNVLRALDRGHGAQRWYAALPLRPNGPPVLAGPAILVSGLVPTLPAFLRDNGESAGQARLPGDLATSPYVIEDSWTPIVVVITRDIAEGDQLLALGRPVEPEIVEVAPLPGIVSLRGRGNQPDRERTRPDRPAAPPSGSSSTPDEPSAEPDDSTVPDDSTAPDDAPSVIPSR